MDEQVLQNILEIRNNTKTENILRETIGEIKPTRKSKMQYIISGIITAVVVYAVMQSGNIVSVMQFAIEGFNTIALTMIAIVFGSYAIFQALLTDEVFDALIKTSNNMLNTSNKSFLHIILLYLTEIIINVVALIVLKAIPLDFYWPSNLGMANKLAIFLMIIYFEYGFLLLLEIKNFTVNLYKIFNVYNIYRALKLIEEDDNKKKD